MSYRERFEFLRMLVADWRAKHLTAERAMELLEMMTKDPPATMQGMEKARALAILAK